MPDTRQKKIKIFDRDISLGTILKKDPIVYHREEILNAGKINHKIHGSFTVNQTNNSKDSIKFFILTDMQYLHWFQRMATTRPGVFAQLSKNTITDPQEFLYSSNDALPQGSFDIQMDKENVIFFILDNAFSTLTSKIVRLTIWEEWDESILPLDVVTTTPPQDTSIEETIQNMILTAKKELKILCPHVDMFFVKPLLEQHDKGIKIYMITRGVSERTNSRENKQALKYIQEKLKTDHQVNPHIHSRIIIKDEIEALVSSADLTETSLKSHYNAGIILSDPTLVQKLLSYFNQAFRDSNKTN